MSTVDTIVTDAQDLEIGSGIVELYEIEIGTGDDNTLYFHPGKDLDNGTTDNDLIFDGNTYVALPIFLEGIEKSAEGASPRPTLTFANVESILKDNSLFKTQMDDGTWDAKIDKIDVNSDNFTMESLIGARVTRRKTLEKYTGDGVAGYEFGKELYIIDRISNKSNIFIEVELASPMDLGGIRLPRRQVIGKYCPWVYQGGETDITKSACNWKTHELFEDKDGAIYSFYFTGNDEPLVLASYLTRADEQVGETYNSSTPYERGNIVSTGSSPYLFWRCERDAQGVDPSDAATQWQAIRTYTVWSDSVTYPVDSADSRKNSYVKHANTIWRAVRENSGITPGTNESAWTRGDTCGKLLKSCKIRYQGIPLVNEDDGSYAADAIPSPATDTNVPLPFGAFPGTRKFR